MYHPYPIKQSPEKWAEQLNFAALERQHGLPSGILLNLVRQESGGNCEAMSPAGAFGLCQFRAKTAAEWNVDVRDPRSSVKGAARYLEYLIDMFGGDVEKGIAAYNCGPGRLRGIVRNHPTDWKQHLPDETKKYVAIVGQGIGRNYAQRIAAGEMVNDSDRRTEAERRRAQLQRVGAASTLPLDQLLSDVFFGIFELCAKCLTMIGDFLSPTTSDPSSLAMSSVRSTRVAAVGHAPGHS